MDINNEKKLTNEKEQKELKNISEDEEEDDLPNAKTEKKTNTNKPTELKICILGQPKIGKSALLHCYIYNKFMTDLESTIEDKYSIPVEIDGIQCNINITDTSGEDEYQQMLDSWISSSEGFILGFSIDNKDSFEKIKTKYEKILEIKENKKFYVLITGCKCDLERNRNVGSEEVDEFCKKNKIKYLETSAVKGINVKETFLDVVSELLKIKFPERYKKEVKRKGKICYCF